MENRKKAFYERGIREQMWSIVVITVIMLIFLCTATNASVKRLVYHNMDEHVDITSLRLRNEIELIYEKIENFCISIGEDEVVQALMKSDYPQMAESEFSLNMMFLTP